MQMPYFKRCLSLSLLLLMVGCSQSPSNVADIAPTAPEISNAATTEPETITKIVALTSLSADIIARLDAEKLVGIPGSRLLADNPTFAGLPTVSEGQTPPSLEKIVALKPDLVVGATGFHDQVLARLEELGIQTLATAVPDWRSLEALTQTLAEKTQTDPTPLLESYAQCVPQGASPDDPTLVLVSNQPMLAPNKESWAGDLLQRFQLNNLVADLQGDSPQQGYVTLSPEKVLAANPEMLIMVDVGDDSINQLKSAPFWQDLAAVKNDRIYTFDYYGLVNPGGLEAIQSTCEKLQSIT
ncbi:ABC transporter substrate-binding protein (plasmid) [Picosynechococcus sp. PCC 11901]|uniref:ABC transporter substrate-binding protein n=2 Tax=Picosynechococcus sp. PCC 11901 TaxID=2579791 RepID=UPI0010FBF7CE|nr:ABC transporter substrate-binding protein [Picosynechococcus sp. PCC 11901]QCS51075.1 ABC transporter substrate-binding protein [Picosynechococcus sp. PCC 11901]